MTGWIVDLGDLGLGDVWISVLLGEAAWRVIWSGILNGMPDGLRGVGFDWRMDLRGIGLVKGFADAS